MATPEVTLTVNVVGQENVVRALDTIGEKSAEVSNKVTRENDKMEVSNRSLAFSMASVIANSVQLGDIMNRLVTGQIDAGRGALLLAMNFLQLLPAINTIITALKGLGVASAITSAISTMGASLPLIIAAAAVAGTVALAAYAAIPSRQMGGSIYQTGPYLLHAGEYVVPRGASPITINIYGGGSPRETGDAVVDALRRAGVV